jgi:hypothetical protein
VKTCKSLLKKFKSLFFSLIMSACPPLKSSTVFCKKFLNLALFHN